MSKKQVGQVDGEERIARGSTLGRRSDLMPHLWELRKSAETKKGPAIGGMVIAVDELLPVAPRGWVLQNRPE
jgi:hypothetical protein